MPRYYKLYVHTGFAGARHEEVVEVPDGDEFPSEALLEEIAEDYMANYIGYGGYECDKQGKEIEEVEDERDEPN